MTSSFDRTHTTPTKLKKEAAKAAWMKAFEDHVIEFEPKYRGKIEWPSAEFFYASGDSSIAAAEQYVENRVDDVL